MSMTNWFGAEPHPTDRLIHPTTENPVYVSDQLKWHWQKVTQGGRADLVGSVNALINAARIEERTTNAQFDDSTDADDSQPDHAA